ncbi:MAG: phage holin family protein [Cyclobacteriaceae bacterium]
MNFIVKILLSSVGVLIVSYVLPGIDVQDFFTAVMIALVLAILNYIVKPILIILTLPVTIVTLGLFLLVINALIVLLASGMVDGFYVSGFWWALFFSLLLSLINGILFDLNKK